MGSGPALATSLAAGCLGASSKGSGSTVAVGLTTLGGAAGRLGATAKASGSTVAEGLSTLGGRNLLGARFGFGEAGTVGARVSLGRVEAGLVTVHLLQLRPSSSCGTNRHVTPKRMSALPRDSS